VPQHETIKYKCAECLKMVEFGLNETHICYGKDYTAGLRRAEEIIRRETKGGYWGHRLVSALRKEIDKA